MVCTYAIDKRLSERAVVKKAQYAKIKFHFTHLFTSTSSPVFLHRAYRYESVVAIMLVISTLSWHPFFMSLTKCRKLMIKYKDLSIKPY